MAARKLVVFSDGTGNSAAMLTKTNVWRTYQALDLSPGSGQLAFYDDGVGTSSFRPLALAGGALGIGLARNVKDIYAFLCRNYRAGDQIYAFGFSRGAFTIRILLALIQSQGLVLGSRDDRDLARRVAAAYRRFRSQYHTLFHVEMPFRLARDALFSLRDRVFGYDTPVPSRNEIDAVNVRFLGLWDTVDAYGLPIEEMTDTWDKFIWPLSMRDRNLWPRVGKACHALALDDERNVFHPLLWNEETETQSATHTDQERLTQVWFSGAHANVGGGYPNDSLAMVPLLWMLGEAEKQGLIFVPQVLAAYRALADGTGPINDPRAGSGAFYRYNPRLVSALTDDRRTVSSLTDMVKYSAKPLMRGRSGATLQNKGVVVARPKIHHSVWRRIADGADRYAPIVLPQDYAVVGASGGIVENLYEGTEVAHARAQGQNEVWNFVWLRRIVYYIGITIVLALLVLPILAERSKVQSASWFGSLSALLKGFVPAFSERWLDYLAARPTAALYALGTLAVMLLLSNWLKTVISGKMYAKWQHVLTPGAPRMALPGTLSRALTGLRTHHVYRWFFYTFLKRFCAPLLILVIIAYVGTAIASKGWFVWYDAKGTYCPNSAELKTVPTAPSATVTGLPFQAQNPCAATGIRLRQGQRYQLEMYQQNRRAVMDGRFPAHLDEGLVLSSDYAFVGSRPALSPDALVGQPSWIFALSAPFKRHFGSRYMKPMARIGSEAGEEHVLEPLIASRSPTRLVSEFTAGQNGELFLYLNDAILFTPHGHGLCSWLSGAPCAPEWDGRFYGNNSGELTIRIRAVVMPELPPEG